MSCGGNVTFNSDSQLRATFEYYAKQLANTNTATATQVYEDLVKTTGKILNKELLDENGKIETVEKMFCETVGKPETTALIGRNASDSYKFSDGSNLQQTVRKMCDTHNNPTMPPAPTANKGVKTY